MMQYRDFLKQKARIAQPVGLDLSTVSLSSSLFPYQRAIVERALQVGRFAIFADTGMGKALMALEWGQAIGGTILLLTPLSVSHQFIREAEKFGIANCRIVTDQSQVQEGINICNYEKLHKFTPDGLSAIILDESSCLKGYDSHYRKELTKFAKDIPYRLCCTATPAPNDLIEISNHAEFLGVNTGKEVIALFFTQDGNTTHNWRLKGHAHKPFYQWLSSWAVAVRKPSDMGNFDDSSHILPPLNYHHHTVAVKQENLSTLFAMEAQTLSEQRQAKRDSLEDRIAKCAELVNGSDETWIIWCELNIESEALVKAIADAEQVTGSQSDEVKEDILDRFQDGRVRVLVSKPSICGFGLNWQHCHNVAFVGLSHSFEQQYQAIRRCWRFGQTNPVDVHFIASELEGAIVKNVKRKESQYNEMMEKLTAEMKDFQVSEPKEVFDVKTGIAKGKDWTMYLGDCIERIDEIEDESVGLSVFSPPFPGMYAYSDYSQDMGNSDHINTMIEHFRFLVTKDKLMRILKPGRLACVHLCQLTAMKGRDGFIGLKDYRGRVIELFSEEGWHFAGEVTIDKNPQIQATRNKERGLLFKSLATDSSVMRMALADYLIYFRKPGDNTEPIKAGISKKYNPNEGWISEEEWIEWAAPVWYRCTKDYPGGIRETDVLNVRSARESDDERHLCLAKDSLVLTYHKGYIPIQDIEVGKDLVLTHKGRWMPVIAKQKTHDSTPVVSLKAAGVDGLILTPDHKLWSKVVDLSKDKPKQQAIAAQPCWTEAQHLEKQYVNLQLPPVEESNLSAKEWWVVGRWLADGHIHTRNDDGRQSAFVSVGSHKIEEFMSVAQEFAGTTYNHGSVVQVRLKDPDRKLRDILDKCGNLAHNKQLPPEAFRLNKENSKALLDGYLSGDGYFEPNAQRWYVSSVSKRLLLGIQSLVLKVYGTTSTLAKGRGERQATIEGRTVNCRQDWVMSFKTHGYEFSFVQDDGAWKRVKSVQDAGLAETWNIQVLEDASYTAEGCIVKNCPLQLGVIERAVKLWSNPGDIVFSPFGGIGSEGYKAIELNRKYIGIELKESYWQTACKNLRQAESNKSTQLALTF